MRILPVYLLLDVSGSMHGEPITAVNNGLRTLHSALRKDPHALEMAYVSVITFSSDVQQVVPLTEVGSFQPPTLTSSGLTSMGQALKVVTECAEKDVKKSTHEAKLDYKPMVFIMTDGLPTDDIEESLAKFKKYSWAVVVACAAGPQADTKVLSRITDKVLVLDVADQATIAAFFKYVSTSITVTSKKVDSGYQPGSIDDLPPPPPEISLLKL